MNTTHPKTSSITRQWHLVDAKGQVLGRVATQIARLLDGKNKRIYSPHVDCGDGVVVINAEHIKIKGNNKPYQKIDFRHSGFPGGHTMTPYGEFLRSNPERAITLAVTGMLPKNKLRPRQLTRLRVYKGESHPHGVQFHSKKKNAEPVEPSKEG